jgi:hypothetical protein
MVLTGRLKDRWKAYNRLQCFQISVQEGYNYNF